MMKRIFLLVFTGICLVSNASEFFLKINSNQTYYAMFGTQTHYNNGSIFRFCDLSSGTFNLNVYQTGSSTIFYSGTIQLNENERMVCEMDAYGNLTVIQRTPIMVQNWFTVVSTSTNLGSGGVSSNSVYFTEFLNQLKKESFDSSKLEKAKTYSSKTLLTAAEITEICKLFSFDSNRLDWAKYAYTNCSDKQNYFLLKPTFSFASSYSELEKYIENK